MVDNNCFIKYHNKPMIIHCCIGFFQFFRYKQFNACRIINHHHYEPVPHNSSLSSWHWQHWQVFPFAGQRRISEKTGQDGRRHSRFGCEHWHAYKRQKPKGPSKFRSGRRFESGCRVQVSRLYTLDLSLTFFFIVSASYNSASFHSLTFFNSHIILK